MPGGSRANGQQSGSGELRQMKGGPAVLGARVLTGGGVTGRGCVVLRICASRCLAWLPGAVLAVLVACNEVSWFSFCRLQWCVQKVAATLYPTTAGDVYWEKY